VVRRVDGSAHMGSARRPIARNSADRSCAPRRRRFRSRRSRIASVTALVMLSPVRRASAAARSCVSGLLMWRLSVGSDPGLLFQLMAFYQTDRPRNRLATAGNLL
jgi:hypothetical protein